MKLFLLALLFVATPAIAQSQRPAAAADTVVVAAANSSGQSFEPAALSTSHLRHDAHGAQFNPPPTRRSLPLKVVIIATAVLFLLVILGIKTL